MPDLHTLLLFAVACLALAATPGPDMLLIASRSVSQGRLAGFATLAGVQAGTYLHAAAAALGLSQLFVAVPVAYDIVRWAGAIYLLHLAWTTWRSARAARVATAPQAPPLAATALTTIFTQGLVTNLLNPKMVLFVLALFPQFVAPDAGSVALQMLILATLLNAIGLLVNGAVILAAGGTRDLLARRMRSSALPHYFLATVFAGLALRLAVAGRE